MDTMEPQSLEAQQMSESSHAENPSVGPDALPNRQDLHRITQVEKSMLNPAQSRNYGNGGEKRSHSNTGSPRKHENGSRNNRKKENPENYDKTPKPSSFIIVRPLFKGSDGPPPPPPTILLHKAVKSKGNEDDQTVARVAFPRGSVRSKKHSNQQGNGKDKDKDKDSKDGTRHFARLLHAKAIKLASYKEPYASNDNAEELGRLEMKQSDGETSPNIKRSPNVSSIRLSSRESVKRSPRVALTPDTVVSTLHASTQNTGPPSPRSPRVPRTSSRLSSHSAKTDSTVNISRIRVVRRATSREFVPETPTTTEHAIPTSTSYTVGDCGEQSEFEPTTPHSPQSKKTWRRSNRVTPQSGLRDDAQVHQGPAPPTSSRSITLHWRRQNRVAPDSIVISEPWIQDSFDLPGIESLLQRQSERQEERYVQIRIQRYHRWVPEMKSIMIGVFGYAFALMRLYWDGKKSSWLQAREKAMNDKYPIYGHLARRTERKNYMAVWAPVRSAPRICERYLSRQGLKRRGPDTEDNKGEKVRPKTTIGIIKRSGKC